VNVRRTRQPVLPLGSLPRVDLLPPSEMRRRDMLARAYDPRSISAVLVILTAFCAVLMVAIALGANG